MEWKKTTESLPNRGDVVLGWWKGETKPHILAMEKLKNVAPNIDIYVFMDNEEGTFYYAQEDLKHIVKETNYRNNREVEMDKQYFETNHRYPDYWCNFEPPEGEKLEW